MIYSSRHHHFGGRSYEGPALDGSVQYLSKAPHWQEKGETVEAARYPLVTTTSYFIGFLTESGIHIYYFTLHCLG